MNDSIEDRCLHKGLKMTGQRRVIAKVLTDAEDHPDVEQLYQRATKIDPRISIATVYRTVKLFEMRCDFSAIMTFAWFPPLVRDL